MKDEERPPMMDPRGASAPSPKTDGPQHGPLVQAVIAAAAAPVPAPPTVAFQAEACPICYAQVVPTLRQLHAAWHASLK